jgi:hypothetical protein
MSIAQAFIIMVLCRKRHTYIRPNKRKEKVIFLKNIDHFLPCLCATQLAVITHSKDLTNSNSKIVKVTTITVFGHLQQLLLVPLL